MRDRIFLEHKEFEILVKDLCEQIDSSGFFPDRIVAIARGGLVPGVMLSHYFNVPCTALHWSKHDPEGRESNWWLADDAASGDVNMIVLDDACDTGHTFEDIKIDWEESSQEKIDWGGKIRFASLHVTLGNTFPLNYHVDSMKHNERIVYPYECFWK